MNLKILNGLRILSLGLAALAIHAAAQVTTLQIDQSTLDGSAVQDIVIDAESGLILITTFDGNWTFSQEVVDPGDPDPVVDLSIVGPFEVDVDSPVTLSWDVSDATSCDTQGGNAAWQLYEIDPDPITGTVTGQDEFIVDFTGPLTFTLRCFNGANNTPDSVLVTGVGPDPEPSGSCPEEFVSPLPNEDFGTWQELTGATWPNPPSWRDFITIPRDGYVAIEFDTANHDGLDGSIITIARSGISGFRFGSISLCPGDWTEHLPDENNPNCRAVFGLGGGAMSWSTEAVPAADECPLDLGIHQIRAMLPYSSSSRRHPGRIPPGNSGCCHPAGVPSNRPGTG